MKNLDYSLLMPLSKNTPQNKADKAKDSETCKQQLDDYLNNFKEHMLSLSVYDMSSLLIAEQDWIKRHRNNKVISESLVGKILKVDFGKTYLLENGLIHYAVCISECNGKYCVIPMTSSNDEVKVAYHPVYRPHGEKRLFLLKKRDGNMKDSALYINDMKFISSGRIIDVGNKISDDAYNNIINLSCEISLPNIFRDINDKNNKINSLGDNLDSLNEKYSELKEQYDMLKKNNDLLLKMLNKQG